MPKRYFFPFLTLIVVPLVISFGLSLSLLINRVPDSQQGIVQKELWIFRGNPVSQTIVPENNGLNVITMYLRNVILRNRDSLIFSLSNANGQEIRRINLNGYNVGDGDNVRFQFEPLSDSAGRQFTITLSAPDTLSDQTAVGVGYNYSTDAYPQGQALAPGISSGDLAFQLFYSPTSKLQLVKTAGSHFLSHLIQPSFIAMLVGSGLLSYFFIKLLFKHHVK